MSGPFARAVTEAIEFADCNDAERHQFIFTIDMWKLDLYNENEVLGMAAYANEQVDIKWKEVEL